jgi:hypothetical protein
MISGKKEAFLSPRKKVIHTFHALGAINFVSALYQVEPENRSTTILGPRVISNVDGA